MCNMLQHHRFPRLGAGYQQTALPFTDRGDHIDHATGDVFITFDVAFEDHGLRGEQRGEVFKQNLVFGAIWSFVVDGYQLLPGQNNVRHPWGCGSRR